MTPTMEASCGCSIPNRADCERFQFPTGCYYKGRWPMTPTEEDALIERCRKLTKDRAEIKAATIERCAQVAKSFIENLIDPKSATMSHWDQIREQCLNYKGSDLPRLNFESLIETMAEETSAAIRALKDKPP